MDDFHVIVIGASAGGLEGVRTITDALPRGCNAAIAVVLHSGRQPSVLPDILNWYGKLPARFARDGENFRPGTIFIAPPDHHLILQPEDRLGLDKGALVHNTRPAIDPLFASAASQYGSRVVGVILSGANQDGAAGMRPSKITAGLPWCRIRWRRSTRRCLPLSARTLRRSCRLLSLRARSLRSAPVNPDPTPTEPDRS